MFTLSLILFSAVLFVIVAAFTRGLLRSDEILQVVDDADAPAPRTAARLRR